MTVGSLNAAKNIPPPSSVNAFFTVALDNQVISVRSVVSTYISGLRKIIPNTLYARSVVAFKPWPTCRPILDCDFGVIAKFVQIVTEPFGRNAKSKCGTTIRP
jgi:hypothetical protein